MYKIDVYACVRTRVYMLSYLCIHVHTCPVGLGLVCVYPYVSLLDLTWYTREYTYT